MDLSNTKIGKSVRLTLQEIEMFKKTAAELGFSWSQFLRRACYLLHDLSSLLLRGTPEKNSKIIWELLKRDAEASSLSTFKPREEK